MHCSTRNSLSTTYQDKKFRNCNKT